LPRRLFNHSAKNRKIAFRLGFEKTALQEFFPAMRGSVLAKEVKH
jgi:hypothetical protein